MLEKPKLLIAANEERAWKALKINFQDRYDVLVARDGAEAAKTLEREHVDVVLTDVKLPKISGMELLGYVKEKYTWLPVVVMTAFGSVEDAVAAMKAGAYDHILKPVKIENTEAVVRRAMEHSATLQENMALLFSRSFPCSSFPSASALPPRLPASSDIPS